MEDEPGVGGVVVGDDHHRALGIRRRQLADDVVGRALGSGRRSRRWPGGKSSAIPAAPIAPSSGAEQAPAAQASDPAERAERRADPQWPPVGPVSGLGLDPGLGAELGEALDEPLGGAALAFGGRGPVDPLELLQPPRSQS